MAGHARPSNPLPGARPHGVSPYTPGKDLPHGATMGPKPGQPWAALQLPLHANFGGPIGQHGVPGSNVPGVNYGAPGSYGMPTGMPVGHFNPGGLRTQEMQEERPPPEPKEMMPGEGIPAFASMTYNQKVMLVSAVRSAWRVHKPKPKKAWTIVELTQVLDQQEALLRNSPHEWTADIVQRVFGRSYDMLEEGSSGWPHLHETVIRMTDFLYKKLRPVLGKHEVVDSLANLVDLDLALSRLCNRNALNLFDKFAKNWFVLCFTGDFKAINSAVARRIWTRMSGNTIPLVLTSMSYMHHLALPPLERRRCSMPRTISFAEALLTTLLEARCTQLKRNGGAEPQRVIWILGATDANEGRLAQMGYFEDAGVFVNSDQKMHIYLVGDGPFSGEWPCGSLVRVHQCSWGAGALPTPQLVVCCNTGLGTLSPSVLAAWVPHLVELLLEPDGSGPPVLLTCRCQAEVRGERALLKALGAKLFMLTSSPKHVRNLYSGMAAHPDIDYDDNGWLVAFHGSSLAQPMLRELAGNTEKLIREANKHLKSETVGLSEAGLPPAVFWGILDLKYDAGKPPEQRVRILESGDGRSSRFSGYGTAIKETVQQDLRLGETLLRRSVLVENKKLTHDLIVESGYRHVRPRQVAFPRVYSPSLANDIKADMGLEDHDYCVLKLCNRQRGAGVIPIQVAELDQALFQLLVLPEDVDSWLKEQPRGWARQVPWGSFEEQLRHWWSNECPVFVVEELCCSQPLIQHTCEDGNGSRLDEGKGEPREFDGTMRVGFSLHQEETPEHQWPGAVDNVDEAAKKKPEFQVFDVGGLRIQWLGGYWKLPIEDTSSSDLRGRVVSVAKQGTAPVPATELHDVYATLGHMVQSMFSNPDLSYRGLLLRYQSQPELGAFIVARLALSMKPREKDARMRLLNVAQTAMQKLDGLPSSFVSSYVERAFGVSEAMFGNWEAAEPSFRKSVRIMPANSTGRFLLGMCLMEFGGEGNLRAAVERMEESLLLDPDFKAPYADIGVAHLRLGDYGAAVEISEAGLSRHPGTAHLLYNMACAKFAMACQEEEIANRNGCRDHCATELRKEALEAFEFARDHRGKEQQWTEHGNQMVAALRSKSRPLRWHADKRPRDGWRFVSWRQ